jgi:hypothetical protein
MHGMCFSSVSRKHRDGPQHHSFFSEESNRIKTCERLIAPRPLEAINNKLTSKAALQLIH